MLMLAVARDTHGRKSRLTSGGKVYATETEIANFVVLAAIGVWTLIRFLATRNSQMITRLIFTFAPHIAFGFAMIMAS